MSVSVPSTQHQRKTKVNQIKVDESAPKSKCWRNCLSEIKFDGNCSAESFHCNNSNRWISINAAVTSHSHTGHEEHLSPTSDGEIFRITVICQFKSLPTGTLKNTVSSWLAAITWQNTACLHLTAWNLGRQWALHGVTLDYHIFALNNTLSLRIFKTQLGFITSICCYSYQKL